MKKNKFMLFTACAVMALGFGAMALSACGDETGKGNGNVAEHEHVWGDTYTTKKRATCSEEGIKVRYCTVPGCTAEDPQPIEKSPHTWGSEPKNTATCEQDGVIIWTCTVCGAEEEGNPVPALGHDDAPKEVTRAATCLQAGEMVMKCARCERETTVEIPQLEHDYRLDKEKSVEATCQAPGKEIYTCVNGCNDTKEEPLAQLDHQVEYETYENPTFEHEGHHKGHCTVCQKEIDEVIPQLVDGANIDFTFKIMKGKRAFSLSSMTLTVVNEKGESVATGNAKSIIGGKYTVSLPIHEDTTYTLKIGNIGGYSAAEVILTPAEPSGEVQISAKLYEIDDPNAPVYYNIGSMMQDFKLTDIDGKEVHLKEILKTNRLVMLDMFFSTCYYCNQQASDLEALYNFYKSKGFAIVGISSDDAEYNQSTGKVDDSLITAYRNKYSLTFPLIRQPASTAPYLYERFGITGFPSSVFIDHEGFVKFIARGAYPKEYLESRITSYLETEFDDLDGEKTVSPKTEADGLMLSMLRGDYLPADGKNS